MLPLPLLKIAHLDLRVREILQSCNSNIPKKGLLFINFDTATQRAYCRLFLTYPHIHDQRFKIRMKDFAIRNDKGPIAFCRHFLTSQALSAQFFGMQLVVIFMMTIAVSTAGVERIFSIMNLIKTSRTYECEDEKTSTP